MMQPKHYPDTAVLDTATSPLWQSDTKRRTRILALDAAARVCSSIASPSAMPGFDGGVGLHIVPLNEATRFVLDMARTFEKYIDGEAVD